jgi:phosphoglycerate dehydrogenase-like enzyme
MRRYFSEPWDPTRFRVALTGDYYRDDGQLVQPDVGLSLFDHTPYIDFAAFPAHDKLLRPEQIGSAQGVIVRSPKVTAESLAGADNLLAIGRFGVGFDSVDVPACTAADVLAFITPGGVDRPVAEATLTWMLALSHQLKIKDRLVREGQWKMSRNYIGWEIRGRTLGIVGLGRIGRAVIEILRSLDMKPPIAYDPWIDPAAAAAMGVRLVSLPELLREADFVSLHCPLTPETRNLIGAAELAMMKPEAFLLNLARGGIVNEDALYDAIKAGRIAGAALDCFEGEPLTEPSRFGEFDNVLLAPHSIAVTREHGRDNGRIACQSMIDLSRRKVPVGILNRAVLDRPGFQAKWKRLTENLSL